MAMEAKMAVSNACPDQEQIFKVIAGKLGKWPARGKREGSRRGGRARGCPRQRHTVSHLFVFA